VKKSEPKAKISIQPAKNGVIQAEQAVRPEPEPEVGNIEDLADVSEETASEAPYGYTDEGLAILDVSQYGGKLVRQADGRALWRGRPHSWKPGPGRPKQEIRDMLNLTLEKAIPKLAKILETEDLSKLSHRDRMRILDFLAKYGLGPERNEVEATAHSAAKLLILPALQVSERE